jgi:acyl-CoA synthetase (AMP-forming)/AMP-acid ligase II
MADVRTHIAPHADQPIGLNVADRLSKVAANMPGAIAVACPERAASRFRWSRHGDFGDRYATVTFAELDAEATRIAEGLLTWGVPPGTRLALLVRPGIEFVALVFGLLRAGMVIVLVDPGLGRRNLIRCLSEAEPRGFIAIPAAQAVRTLLRQKFPRAKWNVTVGRRWFWGGLTLEQLRKLGGKHPATSIQPPDSPAAIIFTSGSTGPPKGVLYTHRMFDTQVAEIQSTYGIEPGGVDLACFPLFALFNSAMGVTTVFPEIDFSRPASADPRKLVATANLWRVTQAFASPAVWRIVGDHCARTGERIKSLRQVFSCGAPVGADVLRKTLSCVAPGAKMHTPYGATECLPVSTIETAEVLSETGARTDDGAGVCVGRKFDSIDWRVIRITDDPIATIDDAEELPAGQIGELIVRGPQASPQYVTHNDDVAVSDSSFVIRHSSFPLGSQSKIADDTRFWHRMGDVGYLDDSGRFWYCGRKSQRVETSAGTMYTEIYEAVFNSHPAVRRSALVGVGPRGKQKPIMILEVDRPVTASQQGELQQILQNDRPGAPEGEIMVVDWSLPVDIRHNAKIDREKLAAWAAKQLRRAPSFASQVAYSQPPAPGP